MKKKSKIAKLLCEKCLTKFRKLVAENKRAERAKKKNNAD